MQKCRIVLPVALLISAFSYSTAALSQSDMPGSKDHTKIPRVAGTNIVGFAESDYDEGVFMTGAEKRELLSEKVEGRRTRIMYLGPEGLTPLAILRNYQTAFGDLGEVREIYTCKKETCFNNLGGVFIWGKASQIPVEIEPAHTPYIYANSYYYKDQIYWYGEVTTSESLYHVSVYSALMTDRNQVEAVRNHPTIHLEVLEVADFKPTLEVVTAADISADINQKGHIPLYGIYFASDSDVVKPESEPALNEIAKVLKDDKALKLYVVGHTDNEGTVDYNEDLSMRRAEAVVAKLTSQYGIAKERIDPIGAGLAAPIATNKTEEGRTLNRRVELVER